MSLLGWILAPILYLLSLLPFFILHRISEILYVLIYLIFGYRKKVVRGNIERSFPEKSIEERRRIERKFYLNFCDLLIETIKTFTISSKVLRKRCVFRTPETTQKLYAENRNLNGISSHLGNWEWVAQCLALEIQHECHAVYKPLSNESLGRMVVRSRERFGIRMVPIKQVREVFASTHERPILLGLLADQAPHDYKRSFHIRFLNQDTHVVTGPGVLTVRYGFTPVWGWMRRTGRSRYEWGIEELVVQPREWTAEENGQIERIAMQNQLSFDEAARALAITLEFNRRLEEKIKMAPEDWLWSHRRWKVR